MIKKTVLYIHGLESDRYSRKFQDLQAFFGNEFNYDFLEWDNDSNIRNLIQQMDLKYTDQPLIIVGDSTGANFAYQLRQLRNNPNDKLILTSPLLTIDKRIADFEFPQSLVQYLTKITEPENCLIIATTKDEILDQNWISETYCTSSN